MILEGVYQPHPKGFGFVNPMEVGPGAPRENRLGVDILIPRGRSGGALSGDKVKVQARRRGSRGGKPRLVGEIIEIIERGCTDFVGVVTRDSDRLWVVPDGRIFATPLELADSLETEPGTKVVAYILEPPDSINQPKCSVKEVLGQSGYLRAETLATMRSHGFPEHFPAAVLEEAKTVANSFEQKIARGEYADHREDLTEKTIITIDPEKARDFDDAISLDEKEGGLYELGVHIADVSHFVEPGSALDREAFERATSVYLEGSVIPMLPEALSNGVCSLLPGEPRLTKSVFITYDQDANVINTRFAETIINSKARLTYEEAQAICDGVTQTPSAEVSLLVSQMRDLAVKIEQRRLRTGMIQLDLPEIELIYGENSNVIDARPQRNEYSHRMIEMFMVEANEAVCSTLDAGGIQFIRRSHPTPSEDGLLQLRSIARALGYIVPNRPTRPDIQHLLKQAEDKPESYALSLAVLKAQSQAQYSATASSHYALASEHYCHFTSPIRRYPDLEVHRHFALYCQGKRDRTTKKGATLLKQVAEHCTERERMAEAAERQLRQILILHFLSHHIGETFDGIIVSIAEMGLFVQHPRFLVEGLIRYEDLGESRWNTAVQYGAVRGETSGKNYQVGQALNVLIEGVNVQRRHLDLTVPSRQHPSGNSKSPRHPQ